MIESNAAALRAWRAAIAEEATPRVPVVGWDVSAPFLVDLDFLTRRPESHLRADGTLKPGRPMHKTSAPDIDKLSRAVLDALTQAGVWEDDSQVVELRAHKAYGQYDGVRVMVRPV